MASWTGRSSVRRPAGVDLVQARTSLSRWWWTSWKLWTPTVCGTAAGSFAFSGLPAHVPAVWPSIVRHPPLLLAMPSPPREPHYGCSTSPRGLSTLAAGDGTINLVEFDTPASSSNARVPADADVPEAGTTPAPAPSSAPSTAIPAALMTLLALGSASFAVLGV